MVKLTLFYNYKIIHSEYFENGIVRIGRDATNDLTIDSPAAAPAHAAIVIGDDGSSTITQLNDDFPLIVNGEKIIEGNLNNNDMITIGMHDIVYNTRDSADLTQPFESQSNKDIRVFKPEINAELSIPAANLQVMDGENIGRILSLKKTMTRLGQSGSGVIVISKRKDGYFVSVLENNGNIMLNNVLLNDSTVKLNDNDVLVINDTSLQFFQN